MKRILLILAACACACAWAGVASARLGSLGRNDTVVTNVTDVTPGNYETVSNAAMSAATRATNYTDAVAAEFADGTRSVRFADYAQNAEESVQSGSVMNSSGTETFNANDLIRESTNAAIAVAARKQDALPYPTNAIPYAAISGAPSGGGQEWRVVNYDVEVDAISFVTNGMANLVFLGGGIVGAVITNGWPDGASMFVRGQFSAETSYTFGSNVRLVGYGTWPTNNFQSVWWRSGTNIFVNVLLEE